MLRGGPGVSQLGQDYSLALAPQLQGMKERNAQGPTQGFAPALDGRGASTKPAPARSPSRGSGTPGQDPAPLPLPVAEPPQSQPAAAGAQQESSRHKGFSNSRRSGCKTRESSRASSFPGTAKAGSQCGHGHGAGAAARAPTPWQLLWCRHRTNAPHGRKPLKPQRVFRQLLTDNSQKGRTAAGRAVISGTSPSLPSATRPCPPTRMRTAAASSPQCPRAPGLRQRWPRDLVGSEGPEAATARGDGWPCTLRSSTTSCSPRKPNPAEHGVPRGEIRGQGPWRGCFVPRLMWHPSLPREHEGGRRNRGLAPGHRSRSRKTLGRTSVSRILFLCLAQHCNVVSPKRKPKGLGGARGAATPGLPWVTQPALHPQPSRRCRHFPNPRRSPLHQERGCRCLVSPRCVPPPPDLSALRGHGSSPRAAGRADSLPPPKHPGFPLSPGVRDLGPTRCCHRLYPPAAKTRAQGPLHKRDGGTALCTGTARSGTMPGQGNTATSPYLPGPCPSLHPFYYSAKKSNPQRGVPRALGQGQPTLGLLLTYRHRHRKGRGERNGTAPLRALAGPRAAAAGRRRRLPGRNIEKTGAYKRVTRGRAQAEPTVTAQESGSVPSPRTHGTREGTRQPRVQPAALSAGAAERPSVPSSRALGSSPPGAASPPQPHATEGPNPDPASPCPILAAGRTAPGSRRRSRQSLGPSPCRLPRQRGRRGRWRTAPSQKLGTPGPCEGPERGWGRETGQASLFVCNRKF